MNDSGAPTLARTREKDDIDPREIAETRQALLAALIKATGNGQSDFAAEEPENDEDAYYTLTAEEMEALVNGNIEMIESWVGNLNKGQATRLLCWLQTEDWLTE